MAWLVALRIRATGGDATAATEAAKALADARGLVRERNRMV
jgi:ClpP class serine protease